MTYSTSIETSGTTRMVECRIHGEYVSQLFGSSVWLGCPTCEEIERAKREADDRAREADRQRRFEKSRMIATGIPERFWGVTFENYAVDESISEQRHAKDFAVQYANSFKMPGRHGRCALFLGSVGTGKTHLACAILRRLHDSGRKVRYATVQSLIQRLKATFGGSASENEIAVLALHIAPDLLVLDEVGVQSGTEFERNTIYSVINGRYEQGKSTIIVSNLNGRELTPILGERVMDRLREGGGKLIPFAWRSMRNA